MTNEHDTNELIDYLVDRKFKRPGDAPFPSIERWREARRGTVLPFLERSGEELEYRNELAKRSLTELSTLFQKARAQEASDQSALAELKDQQRFFHDPQADADFDHWSKMASWTPDEATALSLGKAPEVVSWEKIKPHVSESPFADQYAKRRNLVLRAGDAKELGASILPGEFVAWADRKAIAVPAELKNAVRAAQQDVEDWERLETERDALKEKVANMEKEKPFASRERNTLYKIILGMAKKKYRYDDDAKRQHASVAIAEDLKECGLSVTAQTIRDHLRNASWVP